MGIPRISPYRMPEITPENVVDWQVSPSRAVLLVHDMQRYFLRAFPEGSPRTELVENIRQLREACAGSGIPVAYTAQPGSMTPAQRGLLKDFWGPGMTADETQRSVVEAIAPRPGDTVFAKWRYSAFHRSDLLGLLRRTGRDQLILCGVYAHAGVLMTAVDAFSHDIQPFVVADAVADFSAGHHRLALRLAAQLCAATPLTSRVVREVTRAAA